MRAILAGAVMGVGLLAGAGRASAHHSFAAEYDASKPITLTGIIQRIDFVNPHFWIYVRANEPSGKPMTWNVEMGSPNSLIRRGFTKDTIPVGTQVVINGFRARDGSRTVNSSTITLPDGRHCSPDRRAPGRQGMGGSSRPQGAADRCCRSRSPSWQAYSS